MNFVTLLGGDDVQQLCEAGEDEFLEIMALVGMASKPLHVRRLQKALQEWVKNPGKDKYTLEQLRERERENSYPCCILYPLSTLCLGSRTSEFSLARSSLLLYKRRVLCNCPIFLRHPTRNQAVTSS